MPCKWQDTLTIFFILFFLVLEGVVYLKKHVLSKRKKRLSTNLIT